MFRVYCSFYERRELLNELSLTLESAPTTTFPGRVGRSPRNLAKSVVGLVGRVALLFGRFLVGRWSVFGRVGSVFIQTNYDSLLVFLQKLYLSCEENA